MRSLHAGKVKQRGIWCCIQRFMIMTFYTFCLVLPVAEFEKKTRVLDQCQCETGMIYYMYYMRVLFSMYCMKTLTTQFGLKVHLLTCSKSFQLSGELQNCRCSIFPLLWALFVHVDLKVELDKHGSAYIILCMIYYTKLQLYHMLMIIMYLWLKQNS